MPLPSTTAGRQRRDLSLKPVTFSHKGGTTNTAQFGLIAEGVARVNAALILLDKEAKPYGVRYEHLNGMLLNEFLKGLRAFVEQQHKAARRQEESDSLTSEQERQRFLTNEVTTRLEASQPATKVATREP